MIVSCFVLQTQDRHQTCRRAEVPILQGTRTQVVTPSFHWTGIIVFDRHVTVAHLPLDTNTHKYCWFIRSVTASFRFWSCGALFCCTGCRDHWKVNCVGFVGKERNLEGGVGDVQSEKEMDQTWKEIAPFSVETVNNLLLWLVFPCRFLLHSSHYISTSLSCKLKKKKKKKKEAFSNC